MQNANRWTGLVADAKVFNTAAATTATSVFDGTANRFRAQPLHQLYQNNLLIRLDAASAKDRVNAQTAGGCGTNVWADSSSHNSTSTLFGFNCTSTSGWNGTGTTSDPYRLTFDGVDDFVDSFKGAVEWGIDQHHTEKAAEIWAYLDATSGIRPLFSIGSALNNYLFQLKVNAATDLWTIYPNAAFQTTTYNGHSKWVHYVLTSDTNNNRMYVNGTMIKNAGGNLFTANNLSFTIGRNDVNNPVDGTSYFKGDIAYAAFYNRNITQAEVTALCNALKGRFAGVAGGVTCN